jgi:ArsR family transcriptional regulator
MQLLLAGLRAAAESTRLRMLALCARAELTVTDLTLLLGQSQPRVSRHLKLLCEAGLLDRFREGSYVFYRLAHGSALAASIVALLPEDDPTAALDLERLEAIKRDRAAAANAYFRENAPRWNEIRALYVEEREVEAALLDLMPQDCVRELLDIGTGTGRILEIFAPRVAHALGVDLSREMLAVARANLAKAGLRNCSVRQADMYNLPLPGGSFDGIVIHQVLHYAEEPMKAVAEAARLLRPGGRLVIVDFAPHALEYLRSEHQHRRLGFAEEEVLEWYRACGLEPGLPRFLPGSPLIVTLWPARRAARPQQAGLVEARPQTLLAAPNAAA